MAVFDFDMVCPDKWDGWRVTRHHPKGTSSASWPLSVQRPACPTFGEPRLDVVYVTSASIDLAPTN
jgi:sugar lactone lactonase YvrE